jgi:azurin
MKSRLTFLAAACTLALVACGKSPAPAETDATPPAAEEPAPVAAPAEAPAAAPVEAPAAAPAAPAATASGSDKPAAVVADCATVIEGNDAMQFNVGSITIPASCANFKITLNHTGKLPAAAMGHNVVITSMADMAAVAADGLGAGAAANYVKVDDARVIAHSKLIGGGESTSVSFPVSKLQGSGPYEFFCSFPGHSAIMKGTIAVQ